MNILVVSHLFPSKYRPNSGTFVYQQVKALIDEGHSVTVICPVPYMPTLFKTKIERWRQIQSLPKEEYSNDVKVIYVKTLVVPRVLDSIRGWLFYVRLRFKKIEIDFNNFDLIHAHMVLTSADLATFLKKLYGKPLIITIHGSDLFFLWERSFLNRFRISGILRKANKVIVVSKYLYSKLNELIKDEAILKKTTVLWNGVNKYLEPSINNDENKEIVLITIAALIKLKNHITVFKALKKIEGKLKRKYKYYLIGDGWDKEHLIKQAEALGIKQRVIFFGALEHKKAMDVLSESDVFVMPSLIETFGVAYLEAMLAGKITIGSNGRGISEIINDGVNGFLVDPKDIDALADLLYRVIENYEQYFEIRINANKTIWPHYSWKNNAVRILEEYKNLV